MCATRCVCVCHFSRCICFTVLFSAPTFMCTASKYNVHQMVFASAMSKCLSRIVSTSTKLNNIRRAQTVNVAYSGMLLKSHHTSFDSLNVVIFGAKVITEKLCLVPLAHTKRPLYCWKQLLTINANSLAESNSSFFFF